MLKQLAKKSEDEKAFRYQGFMLGRNKKPTTYYTETRMFSDSVFVWPFAEPTFDIVEFAKCVEQARDKKRSTSVQYRTVY